MKQVIFLYILVGILGFLTIDAIFGAHPPDPVAIARADSLRVYEAEIEVMRDSILSKDSIINVFESQVDSIEEEIELISQRATEIIEEANERAAEAGETLEATFDSLRFSVRPEVLPLLASTQSQSNLRDSLRLVVIEELRGENAILREGFERSQELNGLYVARIEQADSIIAVQDRRYETLERQAEYWEDLARPSFFGRFRERWRTYVTGALAGAVTVCALACR